MLQFRARVCGAILVGLTFWNGGYYRSAVRCRQDGASMLLFFSGRDAALEKVSKATSPHQLPQASYYHIQSLLIAPLSKVSVQNF